MKFVEGFNKVAGLGWTPKRTRWATKGIMSRTGVKKGIAQKVVEHEKENSHPLVAWSSPVRRAKLEANILGSDSGNPKVELRRASNRLNQERENQKSYLEDKFGRKKK
jgi:hypothetical protein